MICGTYASFLYAKWDNYRHNIHHTCANNEECDENFGLIWPSYKFICCTTIVCDENYGDYYFVHSGCATQQQCITIIQNKDNTRFAGELFTKKIYYSATKSYVLREDNIYKDIKDNNRDSPIVTKSISLHCDISESSSPSPISLLFLPSDMN